MEVNEPVSLLSNLGCNFHSKCGEIISLKKQELTEEMWEEIIKYNLDWDKPCFLYFVNSYSDVDVNLKIVCRSKVKD